MVALVACQLKTLKHWGFGFLCFAKIQQWPIGHYFVAMLAKRRLWVCQWHGSLKPALTSPLHETRRVKCQKFHQATLIYENLWKGLLKQCKSWSCSKPVTTSHENCAFVNMFKGRATWSLHMYAMSLHRPIDCCVSNLKLSRFLDALSDDTLWNPAYTWHATCEMMIAGKNETTAHPLDLKLSLKSSCKLQITQMKILIQAEVFANDVQLLPCFTASRFWRLSCLWAWSTFCILQSRTRPGLHVVGNFVQPFSRKAIRFYIPCESNETFLSSGLTTTACHLATKIV